MKNRRELLEMAGLAALPAWGQLAPPREYRVYVGTGGSQSKGIYTFRLDTRAGRATAPELAAAIPISSRSIRAGSSFTP